MPDQIQAERLCEQARDALLRVSTATLTSELLRLGFRNTFIGRVKPLNPGHRLLGYAATLRYIPSREDLDFQIDYDNSRDPQRLAVESIEPEQVLVIDARGELDAASFGHILMTRIQHRGAAGLITDGALRDASKIGRMQFPVYCAGVHATTSSVRHRAVDLNVPIGCGGVPVFPGDVIVGDEDGIVVIPHALAESIAERALEREQLEKYLLEQIESGSSIVGVYPPDDHTLDAYRASGETGEVGG
jgi:regulator of RNase E activity RraA